MNNKSEHDLKRLLRAAARASREAGHEVPLHLERRVLAVWRSGGTAVDDFFSPLPLYRRALALACALVLAALAYCCWELSDPLPDDVVIINTPVTLNYLP